MVGPGARVASSCPSTITVTGSERKTTGSYYTHSSLVNELIKSALLPVMRDRLAAAGLPVRYSNHAGTYLCNHVFYYGLHLIERLGLGTRILK